MQIEMPFAKGQSSNNNYENINIFRRLAKCAVLPLPAELRLAIYNLLEPGITIQPQYPENPHLAKEQPQNPLLGVSKATDDEIQARYLNRSNPDHSPFQPENTTFRIYPKHSNRRMQAVMSRFFQHDERIWGGVRHVELVIDNYKPLLACSNDFCIFDAFNDFLNLQTLHVIMRYRNGLPLCGGKKTMEEIQQYFIDYLEGKLQVYRPDGSAYLPRNKPKITLAEETCLPECVVEMGVTRTEMEIT